MPTLWSVYLYVYWVSDLYLKLLVTPDQYCIIESIQM